MLLNSYVVRRRDDDDVSDKGKAVHIMKICRGAEV